MTTALRYIYTVSPAAHSQVTKRACHTRRHGLLASDSCPQLLLNMHLLLLPLDFSPHVAVRMPPPRNPAPPATHNGIFSSVEAVDAGSLEYALDAEDFARLQERSDCQGKRSLRNGWTQCCAGHR